MNKAVLVLIFTLSSATAHAQWSKWEDFEGYRCRYNVGEGSAGFSIATECTEMKAKVCHAVSLCLKQPSGKATCSKPETLEGKAKACYNLAVLIINSVLR